MTAQYNPLVAQLITEAPLNELGAGKPDSSKHPLLTSLTPESLAEPHLPRDHSAALACCAGLWLRYNFLDESHQLSQAIETPEGSYWHALMHRREGDFDNAKYWFRRVGAHPVFSELGEQAQQLAKPYLADPAAAKFASGSDWDPYYFVDLCKQAVGSQTPLESLCQEIQRREWDLLFDFGYRQATAV